MAMASSKGGRIPEPAGATPLRGRPEPPDGLDPDASAHWDRIVEMVDSAGRLSLLDRDSLTLYIHLWMTYRHAKRMVDRPKESGGGPVVNTEHGPKKSAWFVVMMDAQKEMKTYLNAFGFTPQSRLKNKMAGDEGKEDDKWEGFGVVADG